jgi:N-acetylneuraminate lyase
MNRLRLIGLVAATHTPFRADGSLNLQVVEAQAGHLIRNHIHRVFIGGSTGESHSLALQERLELAQRWTEVARGTPLKVLVHVGSNCLGDAQALAAQASRLGVVAISALAPSYFKPRTLATLVEWCAQIAAAAPETPFYYYDIPTVTGVHFSMPEFLVQAADRIPTLAGIKFTNYDLMNYQLCLRLDDGAFDIAWGADEALLAALSLGAQGAIGTSYNLVAPLYHRLLRSFAAGDLAAARQEQFRVVQLIQLFAGYGILAATKVVMQMLGVDVGPARLPHGNPTADQKSKLREELEKLGFFDWIATDIPQPALTR